MTLDVGSVMVLKIKLRQLLTSIVGGYEIGRVMDEGHWESYMDIMKDGYDQHTLYKYETFKNKFKIFKRIKLGEKKTKCKQSSVTWV